MKQALHFTLIVVSLLFGTSIISSCSPNKPNSTPLPYAERNVGDIKQGVDTRDSSTVLIRVIGKTQRTDGQEMYIEEYTSGTGTGLTNLSYIDTSYYFVKNGYLIASAKDSLDTNLTDIPGNPYYEQYLAKTYPVVGDQWRHTPYDGDTNFYWIARNIGDMVTYGGTFNDVFGLDLYDEDGNGAASTLMTVYYGPGMDWVATTSNNDSILCSYAKIGCKVIGHLWPAKDIDTTTLAKHLGKTRLNHMKKLLMNGMIF